MAMNVIVTADSIKKWRKRKRIVNLSLLILLFILIVLYILLQVNYSEGSFSVKFNPEKDVSHLSIRENINSKSQNRTLYAEKVQFMDNISIKWLPDNIDEGFEGSHNGQNYIAYTFYIENQGIDPCNYWYSMYVDDVVKNVDDAARIILYVNGEKTVYAKTAPNGEAEKNTVKWRNDDDGTIILQQRKDMQPGELDRITAVVFIEGDDPECTNALLGGMLKMHMEITEEHIEN